MPALKRPDWYKADMKPDEMRACLVNNLHVGADLATTLAQRYQNDMCNEIGNEMLHLVIKYGHAVVHRLSEGASYGMAAPGRKAKSLWLAPGTLEKYIRVLLLFTKYVEKVGAANVSCGPPLSCPSGQLQQPAWVLPNSDGKFEIRASQITSYFKNVFETKILGGKPNIKIHQATILTLLNADCKELGAPCFEDGFWARDTRLSDLRLIARADAQSKCNTLVRAIATSDFTNIDPHCLIKDPWRSGERTVDEAEVLDAMHIDFKDDDTPLVQKLITLIMQQGGGVRMEVAGGLYLWMFFVRIIPTYGPDGKGVPALLHLTAGGKTNDNHNLQYSGSFTHRNPRLAVAAALGEVLYNLIKIEGTPFPDMLDPKEFMAIAIMRKKRMHGGDGDGSTRLNKKARYSFANRNTKKIRAAAKAIKGGGGGYEHRRKVLHDGRNNAVTICQYNGVHPDKLKLHTKRGAEGHNEQTKSYADQFEPEVGAVLAGYSREKRRLTAPHVGPGITATCVLHAGGDRTDETGTRTMLLRSMLPRCLAWTFTSAMFLLLGQHYFDLVSVVFPEIAREREKVIEAVKTLPDSEIIAKCCTTALGMLDVMKHSIDALIVCSASHARDKDGTLESRDAPFLWEQKKHKLYVASQGLAKLFKEHPGFMALNKLISHREDLERNGAPSVMSRRIVRTAHTSVLTGRNLGFKTARRFVRCRKGVLPNRRGGFGVVQ